MRRSFSTIVLWGALLSTSLFAQTRPEVYRILGISVEGQSSADPNALIANTGLKVGDEITVPGQQTRTAIERLYGLRLFEDIQIFIENRTPEGVYLLIRVKENPRLERVEVEGNDELSTEDILKKVNLVKGQLVTKQDVSALVRQLKAKYEEDGYLNAVIVPQTLPVDEKTPNRVILKLSIDEGPKVKVDRIRFFGNTAFDDDDLKDEMKETSESAWWKFWTSNKLDRKKYEEDKKLILKFYRKNGYRDAEIVADSIRYSEDRRYLTIDIYVHEGPQYKIRNIVWEGNTVYPDEVLTARLGFQKGDVYDGEKFEQNLYRNENENDVSSLYMNNGYLFFQVEPEEVRVGEDSLDITLHVRERNKFKIGEVRITGNTKTYEKVIRRELYTRPGDDFSRELVIRSARQLAQLNYFNPEKIKPDIRPVDDKTVDLEYSVEEKSSDTFNLSVGYSGLFGFNGAVGLTFNNFSLSEPLRGGAGQVLTFDWQFGEGNRFRTFSIGFQEPWLYDTPTLFGVSLFDTRQIYFYDLRLTGASVRFGRRFRWPDDFFRGDWTFRFQRNDVNFGGGFYPEGITTQYSIAQVISRNSTDSPIFPTQGSNFSLLTEINGGPFLPGNARYHKHVFSADWYVPVFGISRIALAASSTVGFIFEFEDNARIPPQEFFYMGGTGLGQFQTIPLRGYEDRSIGPQNGRQGGMAMIKHSLELRFALTINPVPVYTLLFAEAGNVWLNHSIQNPLDLRRSAGIGVRLLINPIGLVGFDYGYGFDPPLPGRAAPGWQFHFQFGRGF
ncbi:MAG TPA: outer membrane protein assembly factor BamA [Bacteroidota bacterium]|nr:outer membrane protein assembly factor BamA [Bacteroidota bacterium]